MGCEVPEAEADEVAAGDPAGGAAAPGSGGGRGTSACARASGSLGNHACRPQQRRVRKHRRVGSVAQRSCCGAGTCACTGTSCRRCHHLQTRQEEAAARCALSAALHPHRRPAVCAARRGAGEQLCVGVRGTAQAQEPARDPGRGAGACGCPGQGTGSSPGCGGRAAGCGAFVGTCRGRGATDCPVCAPAGCTGTTSWSLGGSRWRGYPRRWRRWRCVGPWHTRRCSCSGTACAGCAAPSCTTVGPGRRTQWRRQRHVLGVRWRCWSGREGRLAPRSAPAAAAAGAAAGWEDDRSTGRGSVVATGPGRTGWAAKRCGH